jgi:hypothetical protein
MKLVILYVYLVMFVFAAAVVGCLIITVRYCVCCHFRICCAVSLVRV